MTFEEIQKTIEGMLQVQKELQQTQIEQSQEIKNLIEQGRESSRQNREQDRKIQQLTGYWNSQSGDTTDISQVEAKLRPRVFLDVQLSLRDIYAKLSKLEDNQTEE